MKLNHLSSANSFQRCVPMPKPPIQMGEWKGSSVNGIEQTNTKTDDVFVMAFSRKDEALNTKETLKIEFLNYQDSNSCTIKVSGQLGEARPYERDGINLFELPKKLNCAEIVEEPDEIDLT